MSYMPLPAAVDIREVGPRDGLQIEAPISTRSKERLIRSLVATGVRRIEATAFVSPRAIPAMADAEAVAEIVLSLPGIDWSALVATPAGAKRAVAAGISHLEYVVSAGDGHSQANVRRSTEKALAAVQQVADTAHEAGGHCEVIIATAWDCPFDGPTEPARVADIAHRAVELGADDLCLGDTIGTTTPGRVIALVEQVRKAALGIPLGAHFHDTRGTGLASAWAAVTSGVTRLDSSVGGLGGCPFAPGASGNIATEELVYMLEDSGISTGLDLGSILESARLAEELLGHSLPSGLLRAGGAPQPRHSQRAVQSLAHGEKVS